MKPKPISLHPIWTHAQINDTPAMRRPWRVVSYHGQYQIVSFENNHYWAVNGNKRNCYEYYLRHEKSRRIVSTPFPSYFALARQWMTIANGDNQK